MIFRRSSDTPATHGKTNMTSSARPNQSNGQASQNSAGHRTPDMPTRPTMSTKPTQPQSPLSVAQNRRTPGTNSNPYQQRNDQLRKLTVGRDISLNGEIATCDHLVVEGNVSATIKGGQILEIAETGSFSGVVDIEQADIAGRFDGDLTVRDKLIIRPGATVTGTIQYGRLQVDTGATLNGQINVLQQQSADKNTSSASDQTYDTVPTDAQANGMARQTPYSTTHSTSMTGGGLSSLGNEEGFLKATA